MNASIHIAVLLCVVLVEARGTDDQKEGHNRDKREHNSSGFGIPSKCDGAILSCCADSIERQKKCFSNFRCAQTYQTGTACSKENIVKVLDSFQHYLSNNSNKDERQKRQNYYDGLIQPRSQTRRDADSDKQQEQYLPQIVRLLQEITTYVRKPQQVPVPQAIYVPYPIPYPVSEPVDKVETVEVPNIKSRTFPVEEGTSWGPVNESGGDDKDGARPISFIPIKPERSLKRLAPKVEHGSVQSDVSLLSSPSTQMPVPGNNKPPPNPPNPCTAAILACCADDKKKQKNCFYNFQCGLPYDNGNACKSDSIRDAFETYKYYI